MTVCALISVGHIFYVVGHVPPHDKHAHRFPPPSGLPLVNCNLILSVAFGEHLFLQLPTSAAPMFYEKGRTEQFAGSSKE